VMGWEGHTCAVADLAAKEQAVASALGDLVRSAEACRAASAAADIVSCGGTGTYPISVRQAGVTEIQAGGGIFCDLRYRRKFGVELECALSVLATVSGRPNSRRIICDAGRKSMSDTLVLPAPVGIPAATSLTLSAEHAAIELAEPASTIQIGDKIEFIVGYVDGTVNLHDTLLGIRDGIVEVAWPVLARGRSD
jgi:D-serine deaminase-like pyridoxal phosphate-dependent protein